VFAERDALLDRVVGSDVVGDRGHDRADLLVTRPYQDRGGEIVLI
jgi:hypothetical protein